MTRLALLACAATACVAAGALDVHADPIHIPITSGTAVFTAGPSSGSVDLVGTHGFAVTESIAPGAAMQGPFGQCSVPECTPGTRIDFDMSFSGQSELVAFGSMTIDGDRYDDLTSVDTPVNVLLTFTGSVIAPDAGPARVTLSTPFVFSGLAQTLTPVGELGHDARLQGHGIGTLTLVPYPPAAGFPAAWTADTLRLDFSQPTPEPSTLVLLGTCLAGAVTACRARRSGVRES